MFLPHHFKTPIPIRQTSPMKAPYYALSGTYGVATNFSADFAASPEWILKRERRSIDATARPPPCGGGGRRMPPPLRLTAPIVPERGEGGLCRRPHHLLLDWESHFVRMRLSSPLLCRNFFSPSLSSLPSLHITSHQLPLLWPPCLLPLPLTSLSTL